MEGLTVNLDSGLSRVAARCLLVHEVITMKEKPGLVSGVVSDPAGKPVTEARVYFTGGPVSLPEIAALTDHHGAFSLSAPAPGTYSLAINFEGFAPEAVTVPVASGQQVQLEIRLKRSSPTRLKS